MKTNKIRRMTALLLSLVVMLSMCLAGTVTAFADSGGATKFAVETTGNAEAEAEAISYAGAPLSVKVGTKSTIPEYTTIEAENLNLSAGTVYNSPGASSTKDFSYKINMPKAGTLILKYIAVNSSGAVSGSFYDSVTGAGATSLKTSTADDGTRIRNYAVSQAGTLTVRFSLYSPSGSTSIYFTALYAPYSVSVFTAPSSSFSKYRYVAGHGDTTTTSTFKIKVPTKGKLKLDLCDADGDYSVYMKTSGFGGYELVSSSNIRRTIGVKKGTYTFYVKSYAPVMAFRTRFYKVTESKYGLKKSTATTLTKAKYKKGLIVTNDKKSHYYKFYNPKLQKVSIVINTSINGGGNNGALKVTLYDKKGTIGTKTIYPETATTTIKLYTLGKNNRLVKGTYKIKVQSYKSGNGYFSIKWKVPK